MVSENSASSICAHRLYRLVSTYADARSATQQALCDALASPDPLVLGGGKAGRAMAEAAVAHRPGLQGIVAVPAAHAGNAGSVRLQAGGHPLPTPASVEAVLAQEACIRQSGASVLFLLSGGASAMLGAPLPGLSLAELSATYQGLLASGFDIEQMNVVRRHLTRWGGGKLARLLNRPVLACVVSDVMSDALETIGSGPLAPDCTTFADALGILRTAAEQVTIPPAVLAFCEAGAAGRHPETARIGESCFDGVQHKIVLSNARVLERLVKALRGVPVKTLPPQTGDVELVAREWVKRLRQGPALYIAGGEPTVRLEKNGFGGRNQHLALSVALEAGDQEQDDWLFLSVATDGADGNTPYGGAWISSSEARDNGPLLRERLGEFRSGEACRELGLAFGGTPTGTNVADIQIGVSGFSALGTTLQDVLPE
jgi:glycerate 2-kinase